MLWNLFKKSCQNEKLHSIGALIYQPRELDQDKKKEKGEEKIFLSHRRIKKSEQGKKKWYKMDNSLARNPFSK